MPLCKWSDETWRIFTIPTPRKYGTYQRGSDTLQSVSVGFSTGFPPACNQRVMRYPSGCEAGNADPALVVLNKPGFHTSKGYYFETVWNL